VWVLTILDSDGSPQNWTVVADMLPKTEGCAALIDFNVPGKPNPPPIKLLITGFLDEAPDGNESRVGWKFTDPNDLSKPPLNTWVQSAERNVSKKHSHPYKCPTELKENFQDMHDGRCVPKGLIATCTACSCACFWRFVQHNRLT
jgi:hypothetical protein